MNATQAEYLFAAPFDNDRQTHSAPFDNDRQTHSAPFDNDRQTHSAPFDNDRQTHSAPFDNDRIVNTFETWIARERANLVGFCRHLTGSSQAAEDLAQETLLTAWQRRDAITDPSGLSSWLKAIARNICRHWHRNQARQNKHLLDPNQHSGDEVHTGVDLADDCDLDRELERSELITLLDRAMGLLPPETRGLLVQHYIEELPQAELAAQAGMTTNAMTVRLHRGKLKLREALTTDFRDDAVAFGLASARDVEWVETRIWCFECGQQRLQARFNRGEDHLCLRCPGCCNTADDNDTLTDSSIERLGNFKAFKPAFSYIQKVVHTIYFEQQKVGYSSCPQCEAAIPIRTGSPAGMPGYNNGVYAICDQCHNGGSMDSWHSLALSLPQVSQFWRENPRIARLPAQRVDIANSPAVLTGFRSMTSQAKIEVAFSQNTFEVIYMD
ncbi:MAG: RNA polymerase sigma factor [Chloroflexota bacterium]